MSIKQRIVFFVAAIFATLTFMVVVAFRGWEKADKFAEELDAVKLDSFKTAHQFRADLEELDYYLLRFAVRHYRSDWEGFSSQSSKLDHWIDEQRPKLATTAEKLVLDQINQAYDEYLAAAKTLRTNANVTIDTGGASSAAFQLIETRSRRLVDLAFQLVGLHRVSMEHFKDSSRASLIDLRAGLFASLGLLFVIGVALARMVWLDLVAPLKAELDLSREIIERQEKLVSLGVLATGVAHEIRNPLTAIKALLFRHQKSFNPSSKEFGQVAMIGGEIDRLENIVRHTLEFAKPSDPALKDQDIRLILAECVGLFEEQMSGHQVKLVLEQGAPLRAAVDGEQFKQVLINLIRNAAESIQGVGKVVLKAWSADVDGRRMACVEIADTGAGIPVEVQKRLFDPFFTTKADGTGLGLAIAARLIQGHGGQIQFKTQINKGTVFSVLLPVSTP